MQTVKAADVCIQSLFADLLPYLFLREESADGGSVVCVPQYVANEERTQSEGSRDDHA